MRDDGRNLLRDARATLTPSVETFVRVLIGLSALLTIACWISLWRGKDGVISKLLWTVLSAIPVLGPLLYAGVHDPPSVQSDVDRAVSRTDWDFPPPDHHSPP